MAKLPRPSKPLPVMPRKSRTRGSAMVISRSMNSYMRALRSVTLQPIGRPSRILKPAIAFFASVFTGFWPEITRQLRDRRIQLLLVAGRLAHAHVDDDLLELRHLHRVRVAELLSAAPDAPSSR